MIAAGLIVVAKRDCSACVLVEDVLKQLDGGDLEAGIVSQDDPTFPADVEVVD